MLSREQLIGVAVQHGCAAKDARLMTSKMLKAYLASKGVSPVLPKPEIPFTTEHLIPPEPEEDHSHSNKLTVHDLLQESGAVDAAIDVIDRPALRDKVPRPQRVFAPPIETELAETQHKLCMELRTLKAMCIVRGGMETDRRYTLDNIHDFEQHILAQRDRCDAMEDEVAQLLKDFQESDRVRHEDDIKLCEMGIIDQPLLFKWQAERLKNQERIGQLERAGHKMFAENKVFS